METLRRLLCVGGHIQSPIDEVNYPTNFDQALAVPCIEELVIMLADVAAILDGDRRKRNQMVAKQIAHLLKKVGCHAEEYPDRSCSTCTAADKENCLCVQMPAPLKA